MSDSIVDGEREARLAAIEARLAAANPGGREWGSYPIDGTIDFDGTAWAITDTFCPPSNACGDGQCAGLCGSDVVRVGAEGCEDDYMSPAVSNFLAQAPGDMRYLLDLAAGLAGTPNREQGA